MGCLLCFGILCLGGVLFRFIFFPFCKINIMLGVSGGGVDRGVLGEGKHEQNLLYEKN